jgi:hypothetical protein
MRDRLTLVACVLTLSAFSRSPVPVASSAAPDLVVHEWGTFTSIAGADGAAVEWTPQAGPQDVPCFVDRFRFNVKGWMPGRIRMETPVVYFYTPRETTVDVSVTFRHGVVTEWFPRAAVTPSSVDATSLHAPGFASSIAWRGVSLAPGAAADFPNDDRPSHYYMARNVDASPLQAHGDRERFLFYRGIGDFEPPLRAVVDPSGPIVVSSSAGDAIGDVILFENRDGAIAFESRHVDGSRATFGPLALDGESFAPLAELKRILVAHGLYEKEATAMVQTWRDSWFEEGARLFYIAPRRMVDEILSLDVTPPPASIARVFVGRIELVTPATKTAVRDALASGDLDTLRKYSRFVEAIADRAPTPGSQAEKARLQAILRPISATWGSAPTCR